MADQAPYTKNWRKSVLLRTSDSSINPGKSGDLAYESAYLIFAMLIMSAKTPAAVTLAPAP